MRICSKCDRQIGRSHRWKNVYHSLLFGLIRWKTVEHHNCLHPQEGPASKTKRLPGEVPLPFPEPMVIYRNTDTGEESEPVPASMISGLTITEFADWPSEVKEAEVPIPAEDVNQPLNDVLLPISDRESNLASAKARAENLFKELA
jgi:hypothetical protein